jgi:hypothetical protein
MHALEDRGAVERAADLARDVEQRRLLAIGARARSVTSSRIATVPIKRPG